MLDYGSTILSEDIHKDNVSKLLGLDRPMSNLLREELSSDNMGALERLSQEFAAVSIGLKKIWSFVEGEETTLILSEARGEVSASENPTISIDRSTTFFKTPIVDRRSAILSTVEIEFGVEEVVEVESRHDLLATFGNSSLCQPYRQYVDELTSLAQGQSGKEAKDLEDLSKKIFTDVHLFYEGSQSHRKRSFIKLWSEFPALYDLCEKGPNRCLERRLHALPRTMSGKKKIELPSSTPENVVDIKSPPIPEIQVELIEVPESKIFSEISWKSKGIAETGTEQAQSEPNYAPHEQDQIPVSSAWSRSIPPSVPEITVELVEDEDSFPSNSQPTDTTNATDSQFHAALSRRGIVTKDSNDPSVFKLAGSHQDVQTSAGAVPSDLDVSSRTSETRRNIAMPRDLPAIDSAFTATDPPTKHSAGVHQTTAEFEKVSDPYDVMLKDFEEYYDEKPVPAADFFAPEELKSSARGELVVAAGQKERVQNIRRSSLPGADNKDAQWDDILEKHDADLHDLRTKLQHETRTAENFTLPSKERIRFRWIHVPANNMLWGPAVLQALASELRQPSLLRALLHRRAFNALQHVPRHKSSHGRFMSPSCVAFFPESQVIARTLTSGLPSPTNTVQMSLFFPYLHWDTLGDLKTRNDLSERRRRQNRSYPPEPGISNSCLEHQMIWWYLNNASDLPFHVRRSLDQYGYPNLSNTKARDLDQVLSKRTRPQQKSTNLFQGSLASMWHKERTKSGKKNFRSKEETKTVDLNDESRVLMVDTLWLWIVEPGSVVTFFPSRRHGRRQASTVNYRTSDVHDRIYNDVNGDPRFARQCYSCFDFAALAVLHTTTALLERNDDQDLHVFGIFEEYLSELTEQQTKSFKEFRDSQLEAETNEDERSVRHMMASLHNRDDLTALLELRDISDELRTLDKLFSDQTKVIDQMLAVYDQLDFHEEDKLRNTWTAPPSETASINDTNHLPPITNPQAINWLQEAKAYIHGYIEQSKDMQQRCESVQEAYKLLLDMKQKQANVAEASLSRLSAEVASEQNRAIMIFTIFTIIFLPLSFFTSLFGMNVSEWSGQSSNPNIHQVFLIAGCISAGIVITALTLAFNKPIRQKVVIIFHRSLKHWPSKIARLAYQKLFGPCIGTKRKVVSTDASRHRGDIERGMLPASESVSDSKPAHIKMEKLNLD
jgi:Mg2+ and Co2+ transporter CorA